MHDAGMGDGGMDDELLPIGTYPQWAKFITNAQAAPGTCGKK